MASSNVWLIDEPTVEHALNDPIVHLIMRRDGLKVPQVRAVAEAAARRLQGNSCER